MIRLLAAFAAVYLIWGSTYLAIRYVLDWVPPFFGASMRFLIAGSILVAWSLLRSPERPTAAHWRTALIAGGCLLAGGNGLVFWAEQTVPTGVAALIVATVPLWMAIFSALGSREPLSRRGWIGIALGFAGVAVLIGPGAARTEAPVGLSGVVILVLASASWAFGSLFARRSPMPTSQALGSGITMLAGGGLLFLVSLVLAEPARVDWSVLPLRSVLALAYLSVIGSIVAFSAYLWLVKHVTPGRVATYAYVNPVVAVLLGAIFLGEALDARIAVATTIIVSAVVLMITGPTRKPKQEPRPTPPPCIDQSPALAEK